MRIVDFVPPPAPAHEVTDKLDRVYDNVDRYFIIHTKSANVDFLRTVDHRGHTIPCWSLAARTQSTEMEALSGTTEQRIEAAAKCQDWGLPVRFKFKPFIPVRGWREEAREMIRLMFERTRPDHRPPGPPGAAPGPEEFGLMSGN